VAEATGVVPVLIQSKIASKLNVLHKPLLLGVGVGHIELKYVESKSGQRLVLGDIPNNIQIPSGIDDMHHLVSPVL
jgi:hypothetical protein